MKRRRKKDQAVITRTAKAILAPTVVVCTGQCPLKVYGSCICHLHLTQLLFLCEI